MSESSSSSSSSSSTYSASSPYFYSNANTYEKAESQLWRKLVIHAEGRPVQRTAELLYEALRVVGHKVCPNCHQRHKDYRRVIFEVWPVAKESDSVQHKRSGYTMLTCPYALPDHFDQLARFIDILDRGSRDAYDVAIVLLYNGNEKMPEVFYIRIPYWIKYEEEHRGTESKVYKGKRKTQPFGTPPRVADQHPLPLHPRAAPSASSSDGFDPDYTILRDPSPPQTPQYDYGGGGGKRRL